MLICCRLLGKKVLDLYYSYGDRENGKVCSGRFLANACQELITICCQVSIEQCSSRSGDTPKRGLLTELPVLHV